MPGVFGTDRPAEKGVAVEHAHLAHIAGVVADGDRLADIGGERGIEEAQSLEMDAVAMHGARLCDHDQERVEHLQAFRHPGKPAVTAPGVQWRHADRAVRAGIVSRDDERADRRIQFRKREARRRAGLTFS